MGGGPQGFGREREAGQSEAGGSWHWARQVPVFLTEVGPPPPSFVVRGGPVWGRGILQCCPVDLP